jgi:hypothetical protein
MSEAENFAIMSSTDSVHYCNRSVMTRAPLIVKEYKLVVLNESFVKMHGSDKDFANYLAGYNNLIDGIFTHVRFRDAIAAVVQPGFSRIESCSDINNATSGRTMTNADLYKLIKDYYSEITSDYLKAVSDSTKLNRAFTLFYFDKKNDCGTYDKIIICTAQSI